MRQSQDVLSREACPGGVPAHDRAFLAASEVNVNLGGGDHAEALFLREVAGRCLPHVARGRTPIAEWTAEMLGELSELVRASDGHAEGQKSLLLRHASSELSLIEVFSGWANVTTAGNDAARAHETCQRIVETIRAPDPDESLTPVTFWALDSDGTPRPMRRDLDTPRWSEIALNYGRGASEAMDRLRRLDEVRPERLILWHGPPGTGKALSRAIEKCRLIAIEKCRSVAIVESTLKLRSIEPGGQARRSAKC